MSAHDTGTGGFKEIIANISGNRVYSWLKFESGTHRVQRVPATESQGRIHTSAVTVAIIAEAEEVDVDIAPNELRVDVFRSSGRAGRVSTPRTRPYASPTFPPGWWLSVRTKSPSTRTRPKPSRYCAPASCSSSRTSRKKRKTRRGAPQVGTGDRSDASVPTIFPRACFRPPHQPDFVQAGHLYGRRPQGNGRCPGRPLSGRGAQGPGRRCVDKESAPAVGGSDLPRSPCFPSMANAPPDISGGAFAIDGKQGKEEGMGMLLKELLRKWESDLETEGVDSPRLSVQLLAAHVLGLDRVDMLLDAGRSWRGEGGGDRTAGETAADRGAGGLHFGREGILRAAFCRGARSACSQTGNRAYRGPGARIAWGG